MLQTEINPQQKLRINPNDLAQAFAHIEEKWSVLKAEQTVDDGTNLGLPYPFIRPSITNSSNFSFQEMYYWDSFFIAQGLLTSGHNQLAAGMLENLIYLSRKFHIIPNASRTYFTSRSQPPFLTTYIFNIYDSENKDINWLQERMDVAIKEYNNVWTSQSHPNWRNVFNGLSRYYDINVLDHLAEAESGWDMTTRFQGKCLSHIPIDLNCLLYKYEIDFARYFELMEDIDSANIWRGRAEIRAKTVTEYLWDEEKGFFFDFDYITMQKSDVWSLAPYYALWSGLASREQAEKLTMKLDYFMHKGGLSATSRSDEYEGEIPTQWAYPNGWAPLHWITINGLQNYGYAQEAELIARSWISNNLNHFLQNNVFREAYNVVDTNLPPKPGVYPPQLGFGWTNAVFINIAKQFLDDDELSLV